MSVTPLPIGKLNRRTGCATRFTIQDMINRGELVGYVPVRPISTVRAAWYGSGLVFGVVCIAMAVFGMGQ